MCWIVAPMTKLVHTSTPLLRNAGTIFYWQSRHLPSLRLSFSFPHFPFVIPSRPHPLEVGPLFGTCSLPSLPFSRLHFYLLYPVPSLIPLEIGSWNLPMGLAGEGCKLPAESGAETQPKSNSVHFSFKICHLVAAISMNSRLSCRLTIRS